MAEPAPIADLTYRPYDGPMAPPNARWKVIARMGMRTAIRKKAFWVTTAFAAWYYFVLIAIVYFVERVTEAGAPNELKDRLLGGLSWPDQFLHGFSYGQLLWLILALLLGAGSIANDNRSNALLVYLSKPVSKLDYLLGKFVGIWVPMMVAMAVPSAVFWLYGAANFRDYGFFTEDPWLPLRLALLFPIAAAFHAALIVGFSSLFNQGRLAGAAYAGVYFITNFFTQLMLVAWVVAHQAQGRRQEAASAAIPAIEKLFYASIDGVLIGLTKFILATDGTPPFGVPEQRPAIPRPELGWVLGAVLIPAALMLWIAWRRIRAVEVVK